MAPGIAGRIEVSILHQDIGLRSRIRVVVVYHRRALHLRDTRETDRKPRYYVGK